MSREITKRFAAIGDDLSPPKRKPAPKPNPNVAVGYDAQAEMKRRADNVRKMVMREFGPGLSSSDIDGIVQADIEYDNAAMTMDPKGQKWWGERLSYIREQARKKARGMLQGPASYFGAGSIESYRIPPGSGMVPNNIDWAQQRIGEVTCIKQFQEMDYVNDCLVVRTQFVDGKVSMERIDRRDMLDGMKALCNRCGEPKFYPDGKTFHLCAAVVR
jgi:hypothetical protein